MLSHLPEVYQLVRGRPGTQTQVCLTSQPVPPFPHQGTPGATLYHSIPHPHRAAGVQGTSQVPSTQFGLTPL